MSDSDLTPTDEALVIEQLARLSQDDSAKVRVTPGPALEGSVSRSFEETEAWLRENVKVSARYSRAMMYSTDPNDPRQLDRSGREVHFDPTLGIVMAYQGEAARRWTEFPPAALAEAVGLLPGLKSEAYKHHVKQSSAHLQAAAASMVEGDITLPLLGPEDAPGPDEEEETDLEDDDEDEEDDEDGESPQSLLAIMKGPAEDDEPENDLEDELFSGRRPFVISPSAEVSEILNYLHGVEKADG